MAVAKIVRGALCLALCLGLVSASPEAEVGAAAAAPNTNLMVRTRNIPGTSDADTLHAVRQALANARVQGRDVKIQNSTSISKSWNGATLFEQTVQNGGSSIAEKIVCTTCYVKGNASAQLTIAGSTNMTQQLNNIQSQFNQVISNITTVAVDDIGAAFFEQMLNGNTTEVANGDANATTWLDHLAPPTLNINFNVPFASIPQCQLQYSFDNMEMYMALDTVLAENAVYTVNLFTSDSEMLFSVNGELDVSTVVVGDLILSATKAVDISNGFHVKFSDGLTIAMDMFGSNVSTFSNNGGQFEFLPVTVNSAGTSLNAVLRVGVHTGVAVSNPNVTLPQGDVSASAGLEVALYANLAEFKTNVTGTMSGNSASSGCEWEADKTYSLAVGAAVGASVAVGSHTWGPVASETVAVYYTSVTGACAGSKVSNALAARTPVVTAPPALLARQQTGSLTTTTLTSDVVYTAVSCLTNGFANCPISLQETTVITSVTSFVTSVLSGVEAHMPNPTGLASSVVSFGDEIFTILSSSGDPISYIPAATSAIVTDAKDIWNGSTDGVSNKLIIGISVGVGVPVLVALTTACCMWCARRRRYAPLPPKGI